MRRLRIRLAHGKSVAPLRGRSVDLGDHDFVVVSGPNESGKSTLAEVLSWVLAGRRNDHEAGLRLAAFPSPDTTTVDIEAAIEGTIDGSPFEVGRLFKIRRRQQGRQPAEPAPMIRVGGTALTPASWAGTIGVETGDDYFRNYRITGPYDADNHVDIGDLLEALAMGVTATASPRGVLERLRATADSLVPHPDGRLNDQRALKAPTDALAAANALRQQALSDERRIDTLQEQITALDSDREALDAERHEVIVDKAAAEAARSLLSARAELLAAQHGLDALRDVPSSWVTALDHFGQLSVALTHLGDDESSEDIAATELEQARLRADLTPEQVAQLAIDESDVDALSALDARRAHAHQQISDDRANRPVKERDRADALRRVAERADGLGCSAEQLLAFARMSADDLAFGDPVKAWSDAEGSLSTATLAHGRAHEHRESTARHRADLERRWNGTGETRAPEAVLGGGTAAPLPSGAGGAVRNVAWWQITLAAVAVTGATALQWWLGVIAVVVVTGAAIAVLRRPQSAATGGHTPSADVVALAGDLIEARTADAVAEAALRAAIEVEQQATENLDRCRQRARVVLAEYGLPQIDTATRAARLRAERNSIVDDERLVAGLQRQIDDLTAAADAASAELAAVDSEAAAIAQRIGVAHLGAQLDGATGRRLLDVVRARRAHDAKVDQLTKRQAAVGELLPDLPPGLAAAAIQAEVEAMAALLKKRRDFMAAIARARQSLDTASEQARSILDDPETSEQLLDYRINELDDTLTELTQRLNGLLQSRGSLLHQLDDITSRADLAAINQAIEQAAADQREVATEGAAWWVAHRLVADVKDEVEANQQPELVRRASELARRITGGHWQSISTDDGELVVRQGADSIAQKSLSAGARDVLRLVIRLAVAEAHSAKKGTALPIILDDPTASVDSTRAPRLFEVLAEFAVQHQVILMTHDEQTIAQAIAVGAVEVPINGT
ncbi:MAG: hypothetical protein ACO3S5_05225 [Ilumatobacteraceae bacterium]